MRKTREIQTYGEQGGRSMNLRLNRLATPADRDACAPEILAPPDGPLAA